MTNAQPLDKAQARAVAMAKLTPLHKLPPPLARHFFKTFNWIMGLGKSQVHKVVEHQINARDSQRTLRVYYPQGKATSAMLFLHGGGGVIGDINTHDNLCRRLANSTQQVILSFDYSLAPEHKYPQALVETIETWNWIHTQQNQLGIESIPIGIGGDSAGGLLAILTCLKSEQSDLETQINVAPQFQVLIYPLVDMRTFPNNEASNQGLLTVPLMQYFKTHFLRIDEQAALPIVSPLLSMHLKECPPTYVMSVGYDPLLPSIESFRQRLEAEGVLLVSRHFPDCMHQLFSVTRVSSTARAATDTLMNDMTSFISQCVTLKSR